MRYWQDLQRRRHQSVIWKPSTTATLTTARMITITFSNFPSQVCLTVLLRSLCEAHLLPAPRSPSPYRPPVDTTNIYTPASIQSPTRRRLPPTPQSPVSTTMPEPEPYIPSNMPPQKVYSPYQSFPSPASLQDGSSPASSKRRLPQEPGYFNGVKPSNLSNKVQTPSQDPPTPSITSSSSSYTSHPNSSYSTIATTVTFDGTTKSPVAVAPMPPMSATAYTDEFDPYTMTHRQSYNPYDEETDDFNYLQPQPTEDSYVETPEPTPVLPPLPPKIPYLPSSSSFTFDKSATLPPREYVCHQYEYELTTEPQSRMYPHLPKRHNSRNPHMHLLQKWILTPMHSTVMCLQMIPLLQPIWKTGMSTPTCMVIAKANLRQKTMMDPLPLPVPYVNRRTCYKN